MTLPTTASPAPATSKAKLGTDYILNALAEEGLSHLFMVPGGLVDPFMPALTRQDRLMPVVAAHEGGAVFMADGYARASGQLRRRDRDRGSWCLQHGDRGRHRED